MVRLFPCRACQPCLTAKMWYWAYAAVHQTELAVSEGRRTWFGTLTLDSEAQADLARRAFDEWRKQHPDEPDGFWLDPQCDYRFSLVRPFLVADLQRYWKRLRKAGHRFSYLVAIERHKSGQPHLHWLLHETASPIRKRELQAQWPFGYSKVVIVGGRSKRSASPKRAAFYVVKYLSKSNQSRQIASAGYRPKARALARKCDLGP
jgi:hypothetical protein